MNSDNDLHLWVERAEEDFELSVSSLRHKQPLIYGATFHAQQCAEKYLKALLVMKQISFPRTHDLAALVSLCQQNNFILAIPEDDLDKLSAYAVEVRYPGIQSTLEEAKEALRIAKAIRKIAGNLLGYKY